MIVAAMYRNGACVGYKAQNDRLVMVDGRPQRRRHRSEFLIADYASATDANKAAWHWIQRVVESDSDEGVV